MGVYSQHIYNTTIWSYDEWKYYMPMIYLYTKLKTYKIKKLEKIETIWIINHLQNFEWLHIKFEWSHINFDSCVVNMWIMYRPEPLQILALINPSKPWPKTTPHSIFITIPTHHVFIFCNSLAIYTSRDCFHIFRHHPLQVLLTKQQSVHYPIQFVHSVLQKIHIFTASAVYAIPYITQASMDYMYINIDVINPLQPVLTMKVVAQMWCF